jgi:hypothetical protein
LSILLCAACASKLQPPAASDGGIRFQAGERAAIERYYAEARRRPAAVPAAIYKPGDRLDSGARPQPLPSDLKAALPHLPEPYTRLVVGADVILVNRNSHDIADVIPSVAY